MDDNSFDKEWELSSGLPLDGMTATISGAEFAFRQNIVKDTVFAALTFTPDEGEEAEQCFSVGKGWVAASKGASLADANGKNRNVNDQTGYGKWIAAAIQLPGVKDALRARAGNPKQAATWVGLRFTLGVVREMTTNPTTQQSKEVSRIVPVEFHGAVGGDAKVAVKAAAGAVKPAAVALSEELTAQLLAAAVAAADHDSFMAAAFVIDGVSGNADAENAVMASGKGSIWAQGQAG